MSGDLQRGLSSVYTIYVAAQNQQTVWDHISKLFSSFNLNLYNFLRMNYMF